MGMATLVPIFGIVFGCGIALLAIWTEYNRDRALIEISFDRHSLGCLHFCLSHGPSERRARVCFAAREKGIAPKD